MPAELAHQKADKHLCVALHRKVRISYTLLREPFVALKAEIYAECFSYYEKRLCVFLINVQESSYPRYL